MRIKYTLLLALTLLASINSLNAQYYEKTKDKQSIKDKLFFGGGLGLQFGDVTAIDISPQIGYKVTEKFHAGIGLSYSYYNYNRNKISVSNYSGSVFSRFFIIDILFAHAEVEALNTKIFTSYNPTRGYRKWIDSYLIGGGYYQQLGARSGMYLLVLWNLNQTEFTPYNNPIIRIGFTF